MIFSPPKDLRASHTEVIQLLVLSTVRKEPSFSTPLRKSVARQQLLRSGSISFIFWENEGYEGSRVTGS